MNRIIRNITTVLVGIVVWTLMPQEIFAQKKCKADRSSSVDGEFSINGTKVQIKSDGNGLISASNNIPIKICEGETIKLKSTLSGTVSTVNYWITKLSDYDNLSIPPNNSGSAEGGYTTNSGDVELKMTDKTSAPNGLSFYGGPGKYVITQYDYATPLGGLPEVHHACQVIEVIAPPQPVISITTCNDKEFQITIPVNANNIYDDYEAFFDPVSGGNYNPIFTGKQTLPYTFKASMPDNSDRLIHVKGLTKTGGCTTAPSTPTERRSVKSTSIYNPTISLIKGTATKGEFKIAVSSQADILRQFYIRDPQATSTYDFTVPFGTPKVPNITAGIDTVTINVPDGNKQYCFLVENMDASCPATGATPFRSTEEICTTPVVVTAENKKNVIKWTRAIGSNAAQNQTPFIYYQVERLNADGTLDKPFPVINDQTKLEFEDVGLVCGQEYTYQVTTNYGLMSTSQKVRVKAISNDIPSKLPRVFATMTNDAKNANVQGDFDPTNKPVNIKPDYYKFYRANSLAGAYSLINTGNSIYKDLTAEVEKKSYCYYMTWTNLCDKESEPSEKVCTVFLKPSGSSIIWTKETSQSVGTDSYIVQRVDPSTGNNIKPLATNLQNVYSYNTQILPETEGQEIYIQIESRPTGWNIIGSITLPTTLSNIIKIFRPSVAMSPQIFTPNGDGQNDKFIVRGKFIQRLKMTIYDRWGNPIYSEEMNGYPTENSQNETTVIGWDGIMNNGNKASEGSYAYKIEITDTIGQMTVKEGALLLAY
jgi:gliding motility-associated-like protein